jgi:acyl-coenzyme A thioesterase PaaI-like protein
MNDRIADDSAAPAEQLVRFPIDGGCFGCSPTNGSGLRLTFRRRGDVIVSDYVFPDRFHGAPGIVHGGIIAAALDEISCAAATFVRDVYVVTGELSVRYRRPCPVETALTLTARVTDEHPRYLIVEADVLRGDERLAHSSGKFFFAKTSTAP